MSQSLTSAESRAMKLLGEGFPASVVSGATGLSESRVSQLVSDPDFARELSELKFKNLQKHNERDAEADDLEQMLLEKLKQTAPLLHRPMEIAKVYTMVNGAKRRGVSAPTHVINQQPVVPLVMPTIIIQNFTKSAQNQIVEAGEQSLVTIQPKALQVLHGSFKEAPRIAVEEAANGLLEKVEAIREKQKASV
jgi:hypothetical protein